MSERMVAAVQEMLDAMSAANSNRAEHEVVEAFESLGRHFCRCCGRWQPAGGSCRCDDDE